MVVVVSPRFNELEPSEAWSEKKRFGAPNFNQNSRLIKLRSQTNFSHFNGSTMLQLNRLRTFQFRFGEDVNELIKFYVC